MPDSFSAFIAPMCAAPLIPPPDKHKPNFIKSPRISYSEWAYWVTITISYKNLQFKRIRDILYLFINNRKGGIYMKRTVIENTDGLPWDPKEIAQRKALRQMLEQHQNIDRSISSRSNDCTCGCCFGYNPSSANFPSLLPGSSPMKKN